MVENNCYDKCPMCNAEIGYLDDETDFLDDVIKTNGECPSCGAWITREYTYTKTIATTEEDYKD